MQQENKRGKTTAVLALIFSFLFFIPGIPLIGALLGISSLIKGRKNPDYRKGMAIASIIIGIIITLFQIFAILVIIWFSLLIKDIGPVYYDIKNDEETIKVLENYFNNHEVSKDNLNSMIIKGNAHSHLNQTDKAIESYEKTIPVIKQLSNVEQRTYSNIYFALAINYNKKEEKQKAIEYLKEGLKINPQETSYQIMLGQLYEDIGEKEIAIEHYEELLKDSSINSEEEFIIEMKLNNLKNQEFSDPELNLKSFYNNFKIKIVPINNFNSDIDLNEVCLVLKSKYLLDCEVLDKVLLNEKQFLDIKRDQYDAEKLIIELNRTFPIPNEHNYLVLAITNKDLYSEDANFIFSLNNYGRGISIISTYRFSNGLPLIEEKQIPYSRRVIIQFISSTGHLLRLDRPTNPHCPLAYPNSVNEFLQKKAEHCPETIQGIQNALEHLGRVEEEFTQEEINQIKDIYKRYGFE